MSLLSEGLFCWFALGFEFLIAQGWSSFINLSAFVKSNIIF